MRNKLIKIQKVFKTSTERQPRPTSKTLTVPPKKEKEEKEHFYSEIEFASHTKQNQWITGKLAYRKPLVKRFPFQKWI